MEKIGFTNFQKAMDAQFVKAGSNLLHNGEYEKAIAVLKRSLTIRSTVYGETHEETIEIQKKLAQAKSKCKQKIKVLRT